MASIDDTVTAIAAARSWDARVALIRKIPEAFGTAQHQSVYAAIAERIYVPNLAPDFAYIHWREEYGLAAVQAAYDHAHTLTNGFKRVDVDALAAAFENEPTALRIFRLLLGFTPQEFAAATEVIAARTGVAAVGVGRVKSMEAGSKTKSAAARACAMVIDEAISKTLFPSPSGEVSSKLDKPDTKDGWASVRHFAQHGVRHAAYKV